MTDSDAAGPEPSEEEAVASQAADDPGYLTETGEAVGDDGSVVPIIGAPRRPIRHSLSVLRNE